MGGGTINFFPIYFKQWPLKLVFGFVYNSREGMTHFPSMLPPTQPLNKCELVTTIHVGGNSVLGSGRESRAGK